MPAIITHYFYGQDMYFTAANSLKSESDEERKAYLLGCQGPDPFESLDLDPRLKEYRNIAKLLHTEKIEECIAAFKGSLAYLSDHERPTGRAYVAGYISHFELDSRVGPFVASWTRGICEAGVEGLDERDAKVVTAEVERDLDEMVLYTKSGKTVETFHPAHECLDATERILGICDRMYRYMLLKVYGLVVPHTLFSGAINAHRTLMRLMRAPHLTDAKSQIASAIEVNVLHRRHSLYRAMAHRARKEASSVFENREHQTWTDPYTGHEHTASFWDLYYGTQGELQCDLKCFLDDGFDAQRAQSITHGKDFDGRTKKAGETL